MIKIGSKTQMPQKLIKVLRGNSLIWYRTKSISFELSESLMWSDTEVFIPEDVWNKLKNKILLNLKLGKYLIKGDNFKLNEYRPKIDLSESMEYLIKTTTKIPYGTKVTITYMEE